MKSSKFTHPFVARFFFVAVFLLSLVVGITPVTAAPADGFGAVYTSTNASGGNEVLVFDRTSDGSLSLPKSYPTGGLGSGTSLGSQSAVVLSQNNHWLFVVNAGSNQISTYAVGAQGLSLADVTDSGGIRPVSLTTYKDWLYVLNAGGSGNITGFVIGQDGSLSPIANSTQPLSNGGAGAAPGVGQIAFNSEGSALVVTEKSTNSLDTYQVADGVADAPVTHASAGAVPFGFAFDRHNHAIVSEAASGSVSSYKVADGGFSVISSAVVNSQVAACWIAISNNGKFAYTTNAGSGTISSYQIAEDGSLTLLNAIAGSTGAGSAPVDMAFSNNGSLLYTLGNAAHTITVFEMGADGSLHNLGAVSVPASVAGLAAQ
ncbi:MAG TPA: beta-propeller fold lactonase family protein [Anaerolineales bacterium]|nr:beta-propeller fold lactonase family protein [Anaerolineales bacterium]